MKKLIAASSIALITVFAVLLANASDESGTSTTDIPGSSGYSAPQKPKSTQKKAEIKSKNHSTTGTIEPEPAPGSDTDSSNDESLPEPETDENHE